MRPSDKLKLAIREVEIIDLLSESEDYSEEELLDILIDEPGLADKLAQKEVYADVIEKFREGGLIE